MIVFEGPDGQGKTTLINEVSWEAREVLQCRGTRLSHKGPPSNASELKERISECLYRSGSTEGDMPMWDRIPVVSELAYTRAGIDPVLVDNAMLKRALTLFIELHNPLFVYCRLSKAGNILSCAVSETYDNVERETHIGANGEKLIAIYDQIFLDILQLGGRIFNYDFVTQGSQLKATSKQILEMSQQ